MNPSHLTVFHSDGATPIEQCAPIRKGSPRFLRSLHCGMRAGRELDSQVVELLALTYESAALLKTTAVIRMVV
jgi:hypothetical protein